MNSTQAQQKALDDLVAPADRLEFGKCNMRLKTDIKPKEATFQVVLDALALTPFYRAFLITKADPDTSPNQKHVQATKGTRLKSKAKVDKLDKKKQPAKKPKAKGLAVLSEVALTKAEQLKLATKRNKRQFHSSHASGSGVLDVPIYEYESKKESWGDSEDDDEDDENNSDDLSDEGDDNNDCNDGNNGDDNDANDDDKQEGDDTNDDDEETDNDRTESDKIKIPILDQSTTE
ncbi:hypothetical protein Tco_1075798 [Tanacetum coccineum]